MRSREVRTTPMPEPLRDRRRPTRSAGRTTRALRGCFPTGHRHPRPSRPWAAAYGKLPGSRGVSDRVIAVALPHPRGRDMISLQHVTKTYRNGVTALIDVCVEVEKGEFIFIVGQSGSGKSTMIRLMLKEEEATKGDVYVAGKNLARISSFKVPHLRRNIGTVFQDYKLLSDKTVFENVGFALEVIGKPKHVIDQRVPEILEYVGLGDKLNSFPDELSGGEQQRVSIARACVNRPLVLLADEPTGNLDPNTSVDVMRLLDKVNRIGTTVVMATHDQAIVDAMRKRVVELDKGRVIRDQARGVYS